MPNALKTPWVTLEVNDVPLSLCNDLGRSNLGMISCSNFFFLNHLLSLLSLGGKAFNPSCGCYLSWLIGIYILEKLASGWSPSASPLLGRSYVIGWVGPAGVFELLGGFLVGKRDKRRSLALWSFGGLFLWRSFLVIFGGSSPLNEWWHVKLANFHWRFPGRKRNPSFWNSI